MVESVRLYAAVCWRGSIRNSDARRLDKLVRRAVSVSQTGHSGGSGGKMHNSDRPLHNIFMEAETISTDSSDSHKGLMSSVRQMNFPLRSITFFLAPIRQFMFQGSSFIEKPRDDFLAKFDSVLHDLPLQCTQLKQCNFFIMHISMCLHSRQKQTFFDILTYLSRPFSISNIYTIV